MNRSLKLSDAQRFALQAALLEGAAAGAAWQAWLGTLDFERDHADAASFNVLPLVFRSLAMAGLDVPHGPRLKGIYRQAWYRSTLTLSRAPAALHALHQTGSPFVLLHAPASLRVQEAQPERPLLSLDLWLPSRSVPGAEARLAPLGWRAEPAGGATQSFRTEAGTRLRLVTRPFPGPRQPAANALQLGAVPASLGGLPVHTMSTLDFVLYACYQAVHGEADRVLTHLADVAHVLRQRQAPASLGARARQLGVVMAGRRALACLCQAAPSAALREARAALAAAHPTLRERLREASYLHPAARRVVVGARRYWQARRWYGGERKSRE